MPLKKISVFIIALMIVSHIVSVFSYHIGAHAVTSQSLHRAYKDNIVGVAMFVILAMAIVLVAFRQDLRIEENVDSLGSKRALWSYLFGVGLAIAIFICNWLVNSSQLTFFVFNTISYDANKPWHLILYLILIVLVVPAMLELVIHHIWMKIMYPYFGIVMSIIILGLVYTYLWDIFGCYSTLSIPIATGFVWYRTKSVKIVIFTNIVITLSLIAFVALRVDRIFDSLLYIH